MIQKLKDSKWLYMLLSVLMATIFWIFVRETVDYSQTQTFRNIPVVLSGERVLEEQGLTIKSVSRDSVTLRIEAQLSVLERLRQGSLNVTVDVSRLSGEGEFPLGYTINYPSNVTAADLTGVERDPTDITVTVGRLTASTFPIQPRLQGSIADGYQAGQWSVSEESVTISGSADQVSQVAGVEAVITGENLTQRVADDVPLTLLDPQGNPLTDLDVKLSVETVYVTLPIVVVRDIPLTVGFIDGGGATAEDVEGKVIIFPETITVSGEEADMEGLESISLGSVNLAQVVGTKAFTFTIDLDPRLENVSGIAQATVTVTIDDLATRTINVDNIEVINVPPGRSAEIVTLVRSVVVRGHEADLEQLDSSQFRIVADLSDVTATGGLPVKATVYLNAPQNVGVIGEYSVVVNIS